MELLLFLAMLAVSGTVFCQDYRHRSLPLWLLLLYGLLVILHWVVWPLSYPFVLANLFFLTLLFGISLMVVRRRQKLQIREMMGLGDVVYLTISAGFFSFPFFVICLNIGLVVALLSHVLLMRWNPVYRERALIPLAGFVSPVISIGYFLELYEPAFVRTLFHY